MFGSLNRRLIAQARAAAKQRMNAQRAAEARLAATAAAEVQSQQPRQNSGAPTSSNPLSWFSRLNTGVPTSTIAGGAGQAPLATESDDVILGLSWMQIGLLVAGGFVVTKLLR